MTLGIIFGETSTQEFSFLFGDADGERQNQLKFAYVEVNLQENGNRVVARVVDINTENPLLAKDTAKFYSETAPSGIRFPDLMSRRFTLYQARCEVLGLYDSLTKKVEPLTQPIKPGAEVELLSDEVLNQLFSADDSWYLHLGYVDTPGRQTQAQVSLNADSIITMHACVFGMTGMGKTTTTAVLLEESMFRGAKTIVFDPHSDYVNLNQMHREHYDTYLKEKVENCEELRNKISVYKQYLREAWLKSEPPWKDFDSSFCCLTHEEINEELKDENLFYRLLNFCVVKDRSLMVDFTRDPKDSQLDDLIDGLMRLNWETDLPEELASRKLTIKFNAFPTLQVYPDKSPYFTMRLIEAMAREGFSEAQVGYVIPWLLELTSEPLGTVTDVALLDNLISKVEDLPKSNRSKGALDRILKSAKRTLEDLACRHCKSLDVRRFVNDFCSMKGDLSNVSTAVFDLSDLVNNDIRRALIYAVMEFAFDGYKSRHFVMGENAHPILFAIEEARTLIPRQEESSTSGEMHPATRAARLAARQIATEGRKMGLGMLVISQKPASVDPLTVSQANTLILHRAINPDDQSYIRTVGESLSSEDLEMLKSVKEGVAIVTGDALKTRMSTLVKVRNRYSEPGTEKPRPIETLWKEIS